MKKIKATIIENKSLSKGYNIISLKSPYLARKSSCGQFINVKCRSGTEPLLRKPFGVHSVTKDGVQILFKIVGRGTAILSEKKRGQALDVIGPLGNGFAIPKKISKDTQIVLVGGGHGVAPLYAVCEKVKKLDPETKVEVLLGGRGKEHVVCESKFRRIGAKVLVATDDGSKGYKGVVSDLLKVRLDKSNMSAFSIYSCGPRPMLKAVSEVSKQFKAMCQVSMDEYLGCGIGVCMGCALETTLGTRLICKDGPVFNAEEVIW